MESPASKRIRLSASRSSLSGRKSLNGIGGSSLSRASGITTMQPVSRIASTTQPTYDFIGGGDDGHDLQRQPRSGSSGPPPLKRTALRTSMIPKPNEVSSTTITANQAHAEEVLSLRSKVNSLDYELQNLASEKSLLALQHEKELREAQARADVEYAKYQSAETERLKAVRAAETAHKESGQVRDRSINEKASLERKLRDIQIKYESVAEEKEDIDGRFSDLQRDYERYRVEEVEGKRTRLENTLVELRAELETHKTRSESAQKRLEERETDVEKLESQVMTLKGQTGGGEELDVLKRELTEQVAHIRQMEERLRDQSSELRRLRDERRGVKVVEEEKRALETEVQILKEAEKRAGELEIQKEILEDERRTWTSLLERESQDNEEAEFDSPEAVVKALVNERIERALAVNRAGAAESELVAKDETVKGLESERAQLQRELEQATKSAPVMTTPETLDSKAYKRLERQRQLAIKEVEYLRAQLKTFDTEETVMMENNNFNSQRTEQIKHLETLVDGYKNEVQSLHSEVSRLEVGSSTTIPALKPRGTKRPATDDATAGEAEESDTKSQLGALLRKNKNLQIALQKAMSQSQLMATEFQATKSQLKALRNSSKTRILELRDNPTAQAEAIKLTTLRTLKSENESLMNALRGQDLASTGTKIVPLSSLDALNLDLDAARASTADKEKSLRRQREIWTEKAAEFRDVIASVLGYRVIFMPNGKVKVSSIFYNPPSSSSSSQYDNDEKDDEDDPENYIMFDGEKGTMKVSGGADSEFGRDIQQQLDFWVKERKEIPCFLAAMTLEFYERFGGGGGDGADGISG